MWTSLPARKGVAFAQAAAEQAWQEGLSKRPDETDEDDGEADQDGIPEQQDGRTPCDGGVQDGKDTRQLQTNQNEHEAIQQKDEHLPHGFRLEPCPRRKEGGGTPRQIETRRHGCQDPRYV